MMVTASRSSTTARVSRNVRRAVGRWVPMTASTARANAMSVAVGMAQPPRASPPAPGIDREVDQRRERPSRRRRPAIGSAARRGSRRSPATNSRLSSRPTTKKKIASRPSAAHVPRLRSRWSAAGPTRRSTQRLVRAAPRASWPRPGRAPCPPAAARRPRSPGAAVPRCASPRPSVPGANRGRRCGWLGGGSGWLTGHSWGRHVDCRPDFPAHRAPAYGARGRTGSATLAT